MVEYSKDERKRRIGNKYPSASEKIMTLVIITATFVALGAGIYYSFVYNLDPFITAVLIIVFILMIPISVFLKDIVFFKGPG